MDEALGRGATPAFLEQAVLVTWHVDYWDYLGWKDPFASKDATIRQKRYGLAWKASNLYTPCVVVAGQAVRGDPGAAITADASVAPRIAIRSKPKKIAATEGAIWGELDLAPCPGAVALPETAHAIAVVLRRAVVTECAAGENGGKKLSEYMVALEASPPSAIQGFGFKLHRPAGVPIAELAVAVIVEDSATMQPIECRLFDIEPEPGASPPEEK